VDQISATVGSRYEGSTQVGAIAAAGAGAAISTGCDLELSGTLAEIMQQLGKAILKNQHEPISGSTSRIKLKSAPAARAAAKPWEGSGTEVQQQGLLGSSTYRSDQFDRSMGELTGEVPVADRCSTPVAVDISTPELESKYLMTEGLAFASR
jgi:hypothetical protein